MSPIEDLHIVAIAGGSGTRFWPASRRQRPKQLLALGSEHSLLAATFGRIEGLAPDSQRWMVVGAHHGEACAAAVQEVERGRVLMEPRGRNTAPAIALAAIHVQSIDPQGILAVFPADHHVAQPQVLQDAIRKAAEIAREGAIVTLGIEPAYPETGYGYIERAEALPEQAGAYAVARFCEKPDLAQAKSFLETQRFFWNAGIFVMRADTYFEELLRQLPSLAREFQNLREVLGQGDYGALLKEVYASIDSISIDYGVMEGARQVVVVPVDCGWSDVGSFRALSQILPKDEAGNISKGRSVLLQSQNVVTYAEGEQVVAAIGVSDLVVVHTPDATLVVPLERAQEVRDAVAALEGRGWQEFL